MKIQPDSALNIIEVYHDDGRKERLHFGSSLGSYADYRAMEKVMQQVLSPSQYYAYQDSDRLFTLSKKGAQIILQELEKSTNH